jgi:LL-diaminopimelate aminotransferase
MSIQASNRIQSLGAYAFDAVDKKVEALKAEGINPTDFGVGDPTIPTPAFIREAAKQGIEEHASSGYPSYVGGLAYRQAIAEWYKRRFNLTLDAKAHVTSTIGSKEAVFNFPEAVLNPGDVVLIPTPGYPPYQRGTMFAEGKSHFLPLTKANGYLPDLKLIPKEVVAKARILWINYPNSPSGRVAPDSFMQEAVDFCRANNLILASDEAYTELYYTKTPPKSALEFAGPDFKNVIVFQSMSKRSAMTGWRIGWCCGDAEIITSLKKLKTNIDSGTPSFVQTAAIAALADEAHVAEMRAEYHKKRDIMVNALKQIGLPDCSPEATIYIWQRVPEGMSGVDFAQKLLAPEIAVVTTPGEWIGDEVAGVANAGAGHVRFALVPSMEETEAAAKRIVANAAKLTGPALTK